MLVDYADHQPTGSLGFGYSTVNETRARPPLLGCLSIGKPRDLHSGASR